MQKTGIQPKSIAVMVAFALSCFGLLLFLWLSFGGPIPLKPKGYRVTAQFGEATTLATEADVRISGVPIGKVKTIEPDRKTGLSIVVMEIQPKYAPLPSDVQATLRQKTLLGETYVELTPGTKGA
jgi:ABC-type transporter Mla subunit MlaD